MRCSTIIPMRMRTALALLLVAPLTACVVGPDGDGSGGGGEGGGGGGGGGGGEGNGITGSISESTTWSGNVLIGGIATIDPGVTVTVAAGATITFKSVGQLIVGGVLDVQGTAASKVTIEAETPQGFQGITVSPGGELTYAFVEQTGGGIYTSGTAKATIVDTRMSRVSGDFLMMNGGTLDVSYSAVGVEPGETDTTHCNLHFGGSGNVIKVTHSNISSSSYGLMFYGGMAADFTYDNWFDNTVDVDTTQTSPVTGNFSNGWFQKGAPSGTGITAESPAAARLPACDGTNDAICAGPRG
jgi:hypothetical protein